MQVEDYDVYAYYANNYKDAVPKFEKLLEDPEFVSYLEVIFQLEMTNQSRFYVFAAVRLIFFKHLVIELPNLH